MSDLSMDRVLDVGFGEVIVYCDGKVILSGNYPHKTVFDIEKRAKPGQDWKIVFNQPLKEEHFERRFSYDWERTFYGQGFAGD